MQVPHTTIKDIKGNYIIVNISTMFDKEENTALLFPKENKVMLKEVHASTVIFWKFLTIVP